MTLEIWQFIVLMLAFFGAPGAWAIAQKSWNSKQFEEQDKKRKDATDQLQRQLDDKFATQEKIRASASTHWEGRFNETTSLARKTERELLEFQRDVAENCVMQKDWVRNQTVLELKLDAVRQETQLLRVAVKELETETRERT